MAVPIGLTLPEIAVRFGVPQFLAAENDPFVREPNPMTLDLCRIMRALSFDQLIPHRSPCGKPAGL